MKLTSVLLLGFVIVCLALYLRQTQKIYFNTARETHDGLQRKLKALEDDLDFLKNHQKQINFLTKKGWFSPQNRLIGGETINKWTAPLNAVRFTIEPETINEITTGYSFKVSRIILETDALLDTDIYDCVANLLKNFPGILRLQKLSIHRNENVNELNLSALRQQKRPNFIIGEIIMEWVSMEGKKHEEYK